LKQIAVSEFHYLENKRRERSKFLVFLAAFFHFYKARRLKDNQFFSSPCRTHALVVVGSDEGFLGALNSQIIEKAAKIYEERREDTRVFAVGRRCARKLLDHGVPCEEFPGVPFPLAYEAVVPLKAHLVDQYLKQRIGSAYIIHARCHSFTRQTVEMVRLLPFNISDVSEAPEGEARDLPDYVVVEPAIEHVLEYTIALWLGRCLYEIYWDSKLSETACRAIELTERYETLSRNSLKTRMRYFRACHEVIDSGIREVFASHHFFVKNKEEVI